MVVRLFEELQSVCHEEVPGADSIPGCLEWLQAVLFWICLWLDSCVVMLTDVMLTDYF